MAMDSEFPFIKLISPQDMIGFSEMQKVQQMDKVFRDADKSPFSCIVIDEVELLLDYVSIGPRFSNTVLSALRNLLQKPPPKDRRRVIFATTSERSVLASLNLLQYFTVQVAVPNVNTPAELVSVFQQRRVFTDTRTIDRIFAGLDHATGGREIGVGIKRVIVALNRSSASDDPPNRFIEIMSEYIAQRSM
jgi:vesicle-fusing ATPase